MAIKISTTEPRGNDLLVCATDTTINMSAYGIINKIHGSDKWQSSGFYPGAVSYKDRFRGTLEECVAHMITDLRKALNNYLPSKRIRRAVQDAIHTDPEFHGLTFDPAHVDQLKLMNDPKCINNP